VETTPSYAGARDGVDVRLGARATAGRSHRAPWQTFVKRDAAGRDVCSSTSSSVSRASTGRQLAGVAGTSRRWTAPIHPVANFEGRWRQIVAGDAATLRGRCAITRTLATVVRNATTSRPCALRSPTASKLPSEGRLHIVEITGSVAGGRRRQRHVGRLRRLLHGAGLAATSVQKNPQQAACRFALLEALLETARGLRQGRRG